MKDRSIRQGRRHTRRDFLSKTALGTTASLSAGRGVLAASEASPSAGGMEKKIALFSGMFKACPLRTAMQEAGRIGYKGIEIMVGFGADHLDVHCTPERAAEIERMAEDKGLEICLIYTTLGGNALVGEKQGKVGLENVERFLDIGDRISCKMLKVTAGRLRNSAYRDDEAGIVAEWLGRACDRAAEHGSRIVAEIHFGQYCETVGMARKMIKRVDRPNFGVIHDAGNLHITGDLYGEDSVKSLGDRIFHVHIKDMVRAAADDPAAHDYPAGRFKRALLNEGDVEHLSLFRGLQKSGYSGYLSCEASGGEDPTAVAKHEFDEMQKLLRRI